LLRFQRLAGEGERALTAGDPEHAAEVLRAALALWRGPALNDLPDRADAAARATALWSSTVQRRVAADVALGRSAEVLPELRGLGRGRWTSPCSCCCSGPCGTADAPRRRLRSMRRCGRRSPTGSARHQGRSSARCTPGC